MGCKTTTVTPLTEPATKLPSGATFYIPTPEDGSYGEQHYAGSGAMVANALSDSLIEHAGEVTIGDQEDSVEEQLNAGKARNCKYVISPTIKHWEDRATGWSGMSDRVTVLLKVIEVDGAREVATAEISGVSAWLTFGGEQPQDMLKKPIDEFVASLF